MKVYSIKHNYRYNIVINSVLFSYRKILLPEWGYCRAAEWSERLFPWSGHTKGLPSRILLSERNTDRSGEPLWSRNLQQHNRPGESSWMYRLPSRLLLWLWEHHRAHWAMLCGILLCAKVFFSHTVAISRWRPLSSGNLLWGGLVLPYTLSKGNIWWQGEASFTKRLHILSTRRILLVFQSKCFLRVMFGWILLHKWFRGSQPCG